MMSNEDTDTRPSQKFEPENLENMSLDQLERYIRVLETEIDRVKAEISTKINAIEAANSFFQKH